jgi:hypothetical protein
MLIKCFWYYFLLKMKKFLNFFNPTFILNSTVLNFNVINLNIKRNISNLNLKSKNVLKDLKEKLPFIEKGKFILVISFTYCCSIFSNCIKYFNFIWYFILLNLFLLFLILYFNMNMFNFLILVNLFFKLDLDLDLIIYNPFSIYYKLKLIYLNVLEFLITIKILIYFIIKDKLIFIAFSLFSISKIPEIFSILVILPIYFNQRSLKILKINNRNYYTNYNNNYKKKSLYYLKIFIMKIVFKTFKNLIDLYILIIKITKIIIQTIKTIILNLKKKYLIVFSIITTIYVIIINIIYFINLFNKFKIILQSFSNYFNLYIKFPLLSSIILFIILLFIYYTISFIIPYLLKKSPIKKFIEKTIKLLSKLYFIYNYINSLFSLKTILKIKILINFVKNLIFIIIIPFEISFYSNISSVLYNIFFYKDFWYENSSIISEEKQEKFSNNNESDNSSNTNLQSNQNPTVNNNFNNFNILSDQEKKNYIKNEMIKRGIYPMEQTVSWLALSTLNNTDGSQLEVDNYVSINLDIISNAEQEARENIQYSSIKYLQNQGSFMNTSEIEENELQRAIKLSIAESNTYKYEGESFAESSNNVYKIKNENINLSNNTQEDEEEELQRAIALSLSQESSTNINSNLTDSTNLNTENTNPSNLDQISNTSLDNINKGKGKSRQT